jgi:hypothetical protein
MFNNDMQYPDISGRRNDDAIKNKCPGPKEIRNTNSIPFS